MQKKPTRDRQTGQYAHSTWSVMCRCGHTLGQHTAAVVAGQRDCLESGCECEKFRKAQGTK